VPEKKQPDASDDQVNLPGLSPTPSELLREAAVAVHMKEKALTLIEAGGAAELELGREDIGWLKLGQTDSRDLSSDSRRRTVQRSRTYAKGDSLCSAVIALYVNYVVGSGIDWTVGEKGQEIIEQYTTSRANRKLFKTQGLRETAMKLFIDGELFAAIFNAGEPGESKKRYMDPLQIAEIITDPEDGQTPLYYKRMFTKGMKQETKWYRDYMVEKDIEATDAAGKQVPLTALEKDIAIIHTTLDKTGLRGEPLLTASIDEAKANRQWMRARLAIALSLAQFVWEVKVKGNQAAVTAYAAAHGSTLGSGAETKPPASPGSTDVSNEGIERKPISQETGAASAQIDGNMLLQRFGAGVGPVYPHYLGAGEAFRLATASTMELPMLKTFGGAQDLICDMYVDEFEYILERADITDYEIDIDPTPILVKDAAELVHAMLEGGQMFPKMLQSEEIFKQLLTYIGISDIDVVLNELENIEEQPVTGDAVEARLLQTQREFKKLAEAYKALKGA